MMGWIPDFQIACCSLTKCTTLTHPGTSVSSMETRVSSPGASNMPPRPADKSRPTGHALFRRRYSTAPPEGRKLGKQLPTVVG
jgi:hypothetical protein